MKASFGNIGSAILVAGILTATSEYLFKKEYYEYFLTKFNLKILIDRTGLEEVYPSASYIDYEYIYNQITFNDSKIGSGGSQFNTIKEIYPNALY